jgi:hypothetical protein
MDKKPYRSMLIDQAFFLEKRLGYTVDDRENLLGSFIWKIVLTNDIKAYIELLSEEINKRR